MDEILIEEKKYISSKRAAKITGYAKDYIGQLCREGRVPARLVGRSWYVLETAIQDHRFGDTDDQSIKSKKEAAPSGQSATAFPSTWEAPRYEHSEVEVLPSVNRLRDEETKPADDISGGRIQETWQAWFDRFDHTTHANTPADREEEASADLVAVTEPESEQEPENLEAPESEDVNIPIRAIYHPQYQPPLEEVFSQKEEENVDVETQGQGEQEEGPKRMRLVSLLKAIQMSGVLLAALMVIAAVLGSGYFDTYITSSSQASVITGVSIYNK